MSDQKQVTTIIYKGKSGHLVVNGNGDIFHRASGSMPVKIGPIAEVNASMFPGNDSGTVASVLEQLAINFANWPNRSK